MPLIDLEDDGSKQAKNLAGLVKHFSAPNDANFASKSGGLTQRFGVNSVKRTPISA
jgi:hypothetical protein